MDDIIEKIEAKNDLKRLHKKWMYYEIKRRYLLRKADDERNVEAWFDAKELENTQHQIAEEYFKSAD